MFKVPPEPCISSCIPGGNPTAQCRIASVLPEPDSPQATYHGSEYKSFPAFRYCSSPLLKFRRKSSSRARFEGSAILCGEADELTESCLSNCCRRFASRNFLVKDQ